MRNLKLVILFIFFKSITLSAAEMSLESSVKHFIDDTSLTTSQKIAEIAEKLNADEHLYFLGQSYLAEFDKNLATINAKKQNLANPLTHPSYGKLLALHTEKIKAEKEIGIIYFTLLGYAADKTAVPEKRIIAQTVLRGFNDLLHQKTGIEKLAYSDLTAELNSYNRLYAEAKNDAFDSLNFAIPDNIRSFFNEAEIKKALSKRMRQARKERKEKQKEIEASAKNILNNYSNKRTPQQVANAPSDFKIYPSASASGNLSGFGFPVDTWALTFDDGPLPQYSEQIFQNLAANKIKATFFVVAQNLDVAHSPTGALAAIKDFKYEHDNGMGQGNHSYSHLQLSKQSPQVLDREIGHANEIDNTLIAPDRMRFFRFPYGDGVNISSLRQRVADLCLIDVFWNVDSLDWQDKNPDSIVARVNAQMKLSHRGIILFHDIHPQSVVASAQIMKQLNPDNQKIIRTVTLPEIVDEINGGRPFQCK
jgi:peptidoglycan/xylan/chitin deacetylase (PgdA/CDA1 family)